MNVVQGNESLYRIEEYIFTPASTTDTLKEGYAVCFNSDATDDYQDETTTEQTFSKAAVDYAEGSQDYNARVRTVEKPSNTNLHAFAGLVHKDSGGAGNGDVIKVMVPVNGVIPCYTDLNCANGQTLLAIHSASYNVTNPVYGGSAVPFRIIGMAAETVDRSSTNGLCWGRIGSAFGGIYEGCGVSSNNLQIGSGASSGNLIAKMLSVETAQTGGDFSAYRIRRNSRCRCTG